MIPSLITLCAIMAFSTAGLAYLLYIYCARVATLDAEIAALRDHAARDGRLLQEAQRLLRDPRARGKNVRHSAWLVEVDVFTREWRGEL